MSLSPWMLVVGILVAILLGFVWWGAASPERLEPSGAHQVGTTLLSSARPDRTNTFGEKKGEPRSLAYRVWYPAEPRGGEKQLTRMDGRVSKAFAKLMGFPGSDQDSEASVSLVDAPAKKSGAPYPVILFSHGGFSFGAQNQVQMEELASQGFVVVAVSHTHEAVMSLFPPGDSGPEAVGIDGSLQNAIKILSSADEDLLLQMKEDLSQLGEASSVEQGREASRQLASAYKRLFAPLGVSIDQLLATRVLDVIQVRADLAEHVSQEGHALFGLLDLKKIFLMGHSLGGLTMMRYALQTNDDESLLGVVSLDVPYILLEGDPDPELRTPLLSLYSEETPLSRSVSARTGGANRFLCWQTPVEDECADFVVMGAAHMNFTDMAFLPRVVRLFGLLGSVEGARGYSFMNHASLSFLHAQMGKEEAGWAARLDADWPEATRLP